MDAALQSTVRVLSDQAHRLRLQALALNRDASKIEAEVRDILGERWAVPPPDT